MTQRSEGDALTPRELRKLRRERVERAAKEQGGVVSRRQLYDAGVSRAEIRANVRADRWARVGRHSISVHRGPIPQDGRHWAAVFEAGPRAHLDGGSALIAGGLKDFTMESIRVSVPRGARVVRRDGLNVRQTRRWSADDVVPGGVPRTRPEVAAVRAALWARSDREAALVLTMTVQQRMCTPEVLGAEMLRIRRGKRRSFLHSVIHDLLGGARSLGELDVARECRRRGLPEPSRQAVRRGRNGRYFLDALWEEWKVAVEIDGIHHGLAQQIVGDAIRQNDLSLQGNVVLRVPLLGLRIAMDEFFAQIEEALAAAGCVIPGRQDV